MNCCFRAKPLVMAALFLLTMVSSASYAGSIEELDKFESAVEDGVVVYLSSQEAYKLMEERDDIVVLDLRSRKAFKKSRIDQAINKPYTKRGFKSPLTDLDRDHTYVVHCVDGSRSEGVVNELNKSGFRKVVHLDGGFKAWKKEDLPTTQYSF